MSTHRKEREESITHTTHIPHYTHTTHTQHTTHIPHYTHTFGTAHWNTKSVIGVGVELVACSVIDTTEGVVGSVLRWNENTTFRPFLSNAVMSGISSNAEKQTWLALAIL